MKARYMSVLSNEHEPLKRGDHANGIIAGLPRPENKFMQWLDSLDNDGPVVTLRPRSSRHSQLVVADGRVQEPECFKRLANAPMILPASLGLTRTLRRSFFFMAMFLHVVPGSQPHSKCFRCTA